MSYEEVLVAVRSHATHVDAADPAWIQVRGDGLDIEVSIQHEQSPLMGFAFHDRSPDQQRGLRFVASVLSDLGVRAFDPG